MGYPEHTVAWVRILAPRSEDSHALRLLQAPHPGSILPPSLRRGMPAQGGNLLLPPSESHLGRGPSCGQTGCMSRTPRESTMVARLSELRRASPADATLRNLLSALRAKLEFSDQIPLYEYEAASEGHEACAAAFRELAPAERQSFVHLLTCLTRQLNESSQTAFG